MKLKKTKRLAIAAAIALIGFSTVASISGTVAWFTASNVVNVSGMSIKAEAENGIVISNEAKSAWAESATASHTGGTAGFIPTSTNDGSTWYHANSAAADVHTQTGGYKSYTTGSGITENAGIGSIADPVGNIYLLNHFYITSSTVNAISAEGKTQYIYLKNVAATLPDSQLSEDLNKSLRILVKSDAGTQIVAPVAGATLSYNVHGDATATTAITAVPADDTSYTLWSGATVPAYGSSSPIDIEVYCYFEGEDANCKSTNIKATMDLISVQASFGHKAI